MYLKYVQIVNFKNLKNVRFEFSKGANTIIGENDSGKSNALTAIRILLDDNYYYNTKRLKETDFSYALGDWKDWTYRWMTTSQNRFPCLFCSVKLRLFFDVATEKRKKAIKSSLIAICF